MTAVLGVSDGACKKDASATDAPAAVREVASVAASAVAVPSASDTASASTNEFASASASPSASASVPKPGLSGIVTSPHHAQYESSAICGVSSRVDVQGPKAVIATKVMGAVGGDERVIASTRPRLRSCANKGLQSDPNETGTAVVTVAVAANGEVTTSSVKSSSGLGGSTVACMASVFRHAAFDAGTSRSLVVTIVQTHEAR